MSNPNLESLDVLSEQPVTAANIFAADINALQQFMRGEIDKTLRDRLRLGRELLVLHNNTNPDEYFIGTTALMGVFEEYGVADAYYQASYEAEEAAEDNDWKVSLHSPTQPRALFVVTYAEAMTPKGTTAFVQKSRIIHDR